MLASVAADLATRRADAMSCDWLAFANSPIGYGIGWFIGLSGIGAMAWLYGINSAKKWKAYYEANPSAPTPAEGEENKEDV